MLSTWPTAIHLILPTILFYKWGNRDLERVNDFPVITASKQQIRIQIWPRAPSQSLHCTVLHPLLIGILFFLFGTGMGRDLSSCLCPLGLSTTPYLVLQPTTCKSLQTAPELLSQRRRVLLYSTQDLHESTIMGCTFQFSQWNLVFSLVVVPYKGNVSAFGGHRAFSLLLSPVPSSWQRTRDPTGPQRDGWADGAICHLGSKKPQKLCRTPFKAAVEGVAGIRETCLLSFCRSTPSVCFIHWSPMLVLFF